MLDPHIAVEFDLPRAGMAPAGDRTFRYAVEFDALPETTRDELARFIHEEQRALTQRSPARGQHSGDIQHRRNARNVRRRRG